MAIPTKASLDRMAAATKVVEQRLGLDLRGKRNPPRVAGGGGSSVTRMKVNGAAGAGGCGTAQAVDAMGTPSGPNYTVKLVSHPAVGQFITAVMVTPNTGDTVGGNAVTWQEVPYGVMFPVSLTQTGGSAGSKTTKCSFSYTVKDVTGSVTLGLAVIPVQQANYSNAKRSAATVGMAYIHTDGTMKVFCIEDRTTGGC
jgi:hypothetical protein